MGKCGGVRRPPPAPPPASYAYALLIISMITLIILATCLSRFLPAWQKLQLYITIICGKVTKKANTIASVGPSDLNESPMNVELSTVQQEYAAVAIETKEPASKEVVHDEIMDQPHSHGCKVNAAYNLFISKRSRLLYVIVCFS